MAFELTQVKVSSELAKALATQLGKTPAQLDEMGGSKIWQEGTSPQRVCQGSECQDGQINLVKLEAAVDKIHGGLCRAASEEGIAYAYIIDNGDGIIGEGDLFVYDYFKKMPWYRPDISKNGFLRLFQSNGKQDLPANIASVVSQIEKEKGKAIDTSFTEPLKCIGYSD